MLGWRGVCVPAQLLLLLPPLLLLGRGGRMRDWNGPHCASGLLPISVCGLCTSLVLHLGCVSLARHVNAECLVQTKLSFLLAWLHQPRLPAVSLVANWCLSAKVVQGFRRSRAPVQRLLCNVTSSLDTVHLALLCSSSYQLLSAEQSWKVETVTASHCERSTPLQAFAASMRLVHPAAAPEQ